MRSRSMRTSTSTLSPTPLLPRIFFGTGKNWLTDFVSFQTVVFHNLPSTEAMTGVMPQEPVTGSSIVFGNGAKVQPPLPPV